MTSRSMAQALGLVLTGIFTAGSAYAADAQKPATQSVTVQGVQVSIDPATGRLRAPTAEERAALAQAAGARSLQQDAFVGQPLTEADAKSTFRTVQFKNGARANAVKVPASLMSSVVAERQPDGSLSIHHDDGQAPAPASAPEVTR
ncbi:hypothetical protein FHW69_002542 [Luteibacter sp. Sphag1AF]|uniref:post-PEP-CTERM-1 domain-containing protein n=1 Tax=Luteibacter sp. Sphag1AF TaxID=2587031 RepID=UPI001617CF25|nr:hypothetical protein [Luteibacter sp. Sphag1AF]MBB3227910.1 hypothetical protein [Luteibacter sp. Sphag1AF]